MLTAACMALVSPAPASAQVLIDGNPLNIWVSDGGQLQVRFDGESQGQFYPPSSNVGNAGFHLHTNVEADQDREVWGFPGGGSGFGPGTKAFQPFQQGSPTGDGSAATPFQQVTVYDALVAMNPGDVDFVATEPVRVTQRIKYRNGDHHFDVQYALQRIQPGDSQWGGTATAVRPSVSGDLYVGGDDSGVGFLEPGPPRVVGGRNPDTGLSGGIVELDAWARHEANRFGTVFDKLSLDGGGLTDTVLTERVDNGVGVAFPDTPLCAGSGCSAPDNALYTTRWRFQPAQAPAPPPPPPPPPAEPAPPPPAEPEPLFPAGTPTGRTIADLPRPKTGQTVNIGRVRGTVLVQFPQEQGAVASRAGARISQSQAQKGFVPLDGSAQIPVGSTIDTNKGVLRLQSGSNRSGSRTQTATFFQGMFEMRQARSSRPVTEMVLKGGSFRDSCRAGSSAGPLADDARHRRRSRRRGTRGRRGSRVRRLWGRGRGRFRTRGRYSSAAVRGTKWVVEERCNGTFIRVATRPRNSRVVVRDFVSRRNITLHSGDSYFAPRGRIRDARISLRPRATSPGGSTVVTGRGWRARRLVTLRVRADGDGSLARVVRVRASRRGGFRKRVRMPRNAGLGRYTVQACNRRCTQERTAPLSVRAPSP